MKWLVANAVCLTMLCLSNPAAVFADVLYNESISGDLSDNNLAPTSLGPVIVGINDVIGSTVSVPIDLDFWTIQIPSNHVLASIVLLDYQNNGSPPSFFALAAGNQIPVLNDPAVLLGATLVGVGPGRSVGDDVLDDLAARTDIGGSPQFSGPLGAGTCTFWYQETNGDTNWAFSFNVSAIPEPAAGSFAILMSLGLCFRRRNRALAR